MDYLLLAQVFRATNFGKSPRSMAVTQVFIFACSQHRYSVDRADALKVEFLNGKIDRRKRVQRVLRDTTTWLAIFLELNASLVVLGTGTGRPTCEKVLVAKTKSFSAVIDKLWHLYLRL